MFESAIREALPASRDGDTGAFQKLVERYQGYAFSLAVRFLGNDEDAQDVTQETFIRIWKHLSKFNYRCKFTTWMYRIVINLCLDRVKSKNKREQEMPTGFQDLLAGNTDIEDENIKKQLARVITTLAAELTPRQRAVFVLRDLQDLNVAEVAHVLDISKSSVKSNLCYARQNIRKRLEQLEKNRRK